MTANNTLNLGPIDPEAPLEIYRPSVEPTLIVQAPRKSVGAAVVMDIFFGFFAVMGVGSIYAGAPVSGLVLMVAFWISLVANFALCFVLIGFVTLPITWIGFILLSVFSSIGDVEKANNPPPSGLSGKFFR